MTVVTVARLRFRTAPSSTDIRVMVLTKSFRGVLVSLMAATTLLVLSATPSSAAKPPLDPVPVSLTCGSGTYSYIQLQLVDRKDNVVGTANVECGTPSNDVYVVRGYASSVSATVSDRVTGYNFVEWLCADTTDSVGGISTQLVSQPLAKKGATTATCQAPHTTSGSTVTVTIG